MTDLTDWRMDGHTRVGIGSQPASQPATHLRTHPNNEADENDRRE